MSLSSDFQKLSVAGLVTLYELDATKLGAGIMRWHGHVSFEDWQHLFKFASKNEFTDSSYRVTNTGAEDIIRRDIIWQGNIYNPMPIQSDGLEMRGDGRASTPSLALANNIDGLQGAISAMCLQFDDFCGSRVTVYHTLASYLDAANFSEGNPRANPNEFRKQTWFVEAKTSENASAVTFELSNPVDMEGVRIPSREITSFCHWGINNRYRGGECQYMGTEMFTEDGTPTDNPELDKCGSRLSDCRIRDNEQNYGGFPSSSLVKG